MWYLTASIILLLTGASTELGTGTAAAGTKTPMIKNNPSGISVCASEKNNKYFLCIHGTPVFVNSITQYDNLKTNVEAESFDEVRDLPDVTDESGNKFQPSIFYGKIIVMNPVKLISSEFDNFYLFVRIKQNWHLLSYNKTRPRTYMKAKEGGCDITIISDYGPTGLIPFEEERRKTTGPPLWGYINLDGRIIIRPSFVRAFPFFNGLALVSRDPGRVSITNSGTLHSSMDVKWEYINPKCETVIGPVKHHLPPRSFSSDRAMFFRGNYCGYIDTTGKIVIQPDRFYAHESSDFEEGIAWVSWDHDPAQNSCYRGINNTIGCFNLGCAVLFSRPFFLGGGPFVHEDRPIRMYGVIDKNGKLLFSAKNQAELSIRVNNSKHGLR